MSMITLYSKPNCPNCDATKEEFENLKIPYIEVNMMKDKDALTRVKKVLGHKQAPVIETDEGHHWSGHKENEIYALAARLNNVSVEEIIEQKQQMILAKSNESIKTIETFDSDWDF